MIAALLLATMLQPPVEEPPVFRAETALALVRFHVVLKNHYVGDLKPEDIILLEDGKPQKLALFEGGMTRRTVPVELNLVFDISGSVTQWGLLDMLAFKTGLLDALPGASLAVYGFDGNLKRFCRPTRDLKTLESAFERVLNFKRGSKPRPEIIRLTLPPKRKSHMEGGTWIFESLLAAARDAASQPGNATRMILAFSDGFPTTTTGPDDVAPEIRELGVPIYPVALGHARIVAQAQNAQAQGTNRQGVMRPQAQERLSRIQDKEREIMEFASMGELTGGRSFDPPQMNELVLQQILGAMVAQVRAEYVVGFTPGSGGGTPQKHKLEVKLRAKSLGKVLGGTRTVIH